ncbi:MAG: 50S ribosomal protein L18 [Candidatus Berkelbacteria bacterium]|nr:50S ribosomal protein L18 [Candidatus Berkelbacteria bacterium]
MNILKGNSKRPRCVAFRSNRYITGQFVDDEKNVTLFSKSTKMIEGKQKPTEKAKILGQELAKLAKSKKINAIVFDRNGAKYHGQIKSLAEGLREEGMEF